MTRTSQETSQLSEIVERRLKAAHMLLAKKRCAEVASAVGVTRQTIRMWKQRLDAGGLDALREMPERGRPRRLNEQQLAALHHAFSQGPLYHGFDTAQWSIRHVETLIKRMYNVLFSQTQAWRILNDWLLSRGSVDDPPHYTVAPRPRADEHDRPIWRLFN